MHIRRSFAPFAVSALILAAAGPAAALDVGQKAPGFALPLAGASGNVALADEIARHPVIVVMFISTRCPVSNAYDGRMEDLEKAYGSRGVRFIGINSNVNEPIDEVASHARAHGFTFSIAKDEGNRIADAYGALQTPEIFVVDSSGLLRYHGRIDENRDDPTGVKSPDLKNALDALLAGRAVPIPSTKAFGCSIKRG